jgi:hypothetical protein
MNKILIAAALLVATAVPTLPAYAATMAMPAPTAAQCKMMPLLPGCMAMMKTAHDSMMAAPAPKMAMTMPKMAMPAMTMPAAMAPMWPTCVMAPAGAGHLLDCTLPKGWK